MTSAVLAALLIGFLAGAVVTAAAEARTHWVEEKYKEWRAANPPALYQRRREQ